MIRHAVLDGGFLVGVVWQTTLALALGALLCIGWRRRPGRAHFCLSLGLVASLALPIAALAVRYADMGLFPPPLRAAEIAAPIESSAAGAPAMLPVSVTEQPSTRATIWNVVPLIGGLWLGVSALLGLRLLVGLGYGIRLLAGARPLVSERLYATLESAMALLGVRHTPSTFSTDAVRCPAIWCWGIRPALLLPSAMVSAPERWSEGQWRSIFLHELAHLQRRDHLAAIVAEVVCALFWWQPLAWWSRARLNALGDEACDRWVVANGQASDIYAETLLGMLPQWRSLSALSMVGGKRGLKQRVAAILAPVSSAPNLGRQWMMATAVVASCLVLVAACMQTQAPPETDEVEVAQTLTLADPGMEADEPSQRAWRRGGGGRWCRVCTRHHGIEKRFCQPVLAQVGATLFPDRAMDADPFRAGSGPSTTGAAERLGQGGTGV